MPKCQCWFIPIIFISLFASKTSIRKVMTISSFNDQYSSVLKEWNKESFKLMKDLCITNTDGYAYYVSYKIIFPDGTTDKYTSCLPWNVLYLFSNHSPIAQYLWTWLVDNLGEYCLKRGGGPKIKQSQPNTIFVILGQDDIHITLSTVEADMILCEIQRKVKLWNARRDKLIGLIHCESFSSEQINHNILHYQINYLDSAKNHLAIEIYDDDKVIIRKKKDMSIVCVCNHCRVINEGKV